MYSALRARVFAVTVVFSMVKAISAKALGAASPCASMLAVVSAVPVSQLPASAKGLKEDVVVSCVPVPEKSVSASA